MKANEQNPTFTNALAGSPSLYLRQHQHNPVMWYPWGEEAFELAKDQDRPILLSIGYSSCYWCHVMEREVFENVSIASYMNERFVCIKLDREEYPLVDETYMVARQLITQEGGWPNNIFLTPELKPFYACGTLGAKDTQQRPSFQRVLEWIHAQWHSERDVLDKQASDTHQMAKNFLAIRHHKHTNRLPLSSIIHGITDALIGAHDDVNGGFFKQPKFPHETYLSYLLHAGEALDYKPAVDTAIHSLMWMASGGIYDQIGCGFHRYAVDSNWYVPHFEKMLYNQALCASVYTDAAKLTNNPFLADIAKGILDFTAGPMKAESGAFYTAIDAETDGVEGAYYSWTAQEILDVLDEKEAEFFQHYYALADIPHFPGHKAPAGQAVILRKPLWDAAKEKDIPYTQIAGIAGQILNKLLNHRNQRQAPLLDDKIITSWNGLMIKAYAEAAKQFEHEKYAKLAVNAGRYFYQRIQDKNGLLYHSYDGIDPITAPSLEDYAYLAAGIIAIATHTDDESVDWLTFAGELLTRAKLMFFDEEVGNYRLNMEEPETGIDIRHTTDSALPSAIGVLLNAYVSYYEATQNADILEACKQLRDSYQPTIQTQGMPEYAELAKGLVRLAVVEKDEAFISDTQQLLYARTETHEVVKVSASMPPDAVVEDDGTIDLTIKLAISDGWMIDAIGGAGPESTTKIEITGHNVSAIESMELPDATVIDAPGGSGKKLVYQGQIEILAKLRCTHAEERQIIEVKASYQPCDDKQCYTPQIRRHYL